MYSHARYGKTEEKQMLQGFTNQNNETNDIHQRVADQNIQSIEDRQEELRHAKNGFIGMLAGIVVGGVVGWLFLGPADHMNKEKEIPVIRAPIVAAKVLPNDPGGMEIDNQDREIYHIVDNTPKIQEEIKIRPTPDMPKIDIDKKISTSDEMQSLVESINEDDSLNIQDSEFEKNSIKEIKNASVELSGIKTNSKDKIIIPEKIDDIKVKLQKTINAQAQKTKDIEEKTNATVKESIKNNNFAKGTWYTQIIASSSRRAVQSLWTNLTERHSFIKKYPHEIEEIKTAQGTSLYRLKVGSFNSREEAVELSNLLKKKQISSIIKQN